jgi:putative IMPACT (imprinted ancient) family translation regulator
MKLLAQEKHVEKKSKFLAFLYHVDTSEEIETVISACKKEHAKAAHICYGYVFNGEEVFKNDGEVGHPGRALLEVLKEQKATQHILLVARYYGGIKLGPGGVRRAFKESGKLLYTPHT